MDVKNTLEAQAFAPDKMRKVNLFETERMFCDLYCFEPGQEQKPHTHSAQDKVYFVLEGEGRVRIGAEEKGLSRYEIVIVPPGQEHGVVNPGPGRLVLLVFMAPKP